jgi:Holliday junction resolvasome RuvABC endonuclease subunit
VNVLGLDLSLTGTGVATPDGGTRTLHTVLRGLDRLRFLRSEIRELADPADGTVDLVAIEGYSMGTQRQASHAHALGELGGVIRLMLHDLGVPTVDIPPASVKKYATGKGNANKNDMLLAAVKRLNYEGNSNDEADALWLRAMTLDHYCDGEARLLNDVVVLPAAHRAALDAIAWPELAPAVRS